MKRFIDPIVIILFITIFIPAQMAEMTIDEDNNDLISILQEDIRAKQYDQVEIRIITNTTLDPYDITLLTNIDSWIKGIPPISVQLPYADLNGALVMDPFNNTFSFLMDISDQMIWYDGNGMQDNITITFAVLCIHNGTEDMEFIPVTLSDVNDPPHIEGDLIYSPEIVYAGDTVDIRVTGTHDPDMDPVTLIWDTFDDEEITGERISVVFQEPGNHPVTATVTDGLLSNSRNIIIEVLPVVEEEEINTGNQTKPEQIEERRPLPWFIVPILLLMILIILAFGVLNRTRKEEENPRKLWSMSPLRGASGYERTKLQDRLEQVKRGKVMADGENAMDEDISRWEKDWDFDPGF